MIKSYIAINISINTGGKIGIVFFVISPRGCIRPASLLFVAPKILFLHYVFWLGRHVYTGTCLYANDTQTTCYWVTYCCERNF